MNQPNSGSMPHPTGNSTKIWGRAVIGALLGSIVGYFAFKFMLNYGLYGPAIPGAAVGIGAGFYLTRKHIAVGLFSAVVATIVGVCSDYSITVVDNFANYLTGQSPATYLMLGLGTAMGYWFGVGRDRYA